MEGLEKVGHIWVDSGQVLIVDPCYLKDWEDDDFEDTGGEYPNSGEFSFNGICQLTSEKNYGQLKHGAVGSSTGWGDGIYPVYAKVNSKGRVEKLIIQFMEEEEE